MRVRQGWHTWARLQEVCGPTHCTIFQSLHSSRFLETMLNKITFASGISADEDSRLCAREIGRDWAITVRCDSCNRLESWEQFSRTDFGDTFSVLISETIKLQARLLSYFSCRPNDPIYDNKCNLAHKFCKPWTLHPWSGISLAFEATFRPRCWSRWMLLKILFPWSPLKRATKKRLNDNKTGLLLSRMP